MTEELTASQIENQIVEYCDHIPFCLCYKQKTEGGMRGNRRVKATKAEKKGKSDLAGCYQGFAFYPEVKTPNDYQTKDQKEFERQVKNALAPYWMVGSLDEFIIEFTPFKKKIDVLIDKMKTELIFDILTDI